MRTRRRFVLGAVGAGTLAVVAWPLHAQQFNARQFHPQPENSHLHRFLVAIWDSVRAETHGQLDVAVSANNAGVPVGEPELLKMIQSGELEFFVLNGNILSQAHPVADIQGIPFAYTSSAQATSLWDGELGVHMRRELASRGVQLIPFGALENGFKQIVSVARPIHGVEDLEGFKMRVPNGALFVDFYRTLNATPVVVNFNRLYASLAERRVDGQENPLVIALENRLFEVCDFASMSNHQWAGFNLIASQAYWTRLPEDVQNAVVRAAARVVPEQRAFVRALNASARPELEARHMAFNEVDVQSFRSALRARGFYLRWRESVGAKAWGLLEAAVGPVG
jgi:tripartite ATP-independent transporter DctP family solute receptor